MGIDRARNRLCSRQRNLGKLPISSQLGTSSMFGEYSALNMNDGFAAHLKASQCCWPKCKQAVLTAQAEFTPGTVP